MRLRAIAFVVFAFTAPLFAAHKVDLSCTPGTGGGAVTGFNFYRGTASGGPYAILNGTPQTTCAYTDSSPEVQVEGSKFFYVATAIGPGGESLKSSETNATIPFSVPAIPTALKAVPQ